LFNSAAQVVQEKNMALSSVEARCVAAERRASGDPPPNNFPPNNFAHSRDVHGALTR
jgi:hypothetical protein